MSGADSRNHLMNVSGWSCHLLLSSNRVVVELSALLLELVVTHIKSVSPERVAHSHLVLRLTCLSWVLMDPRVLARWVVIFVIVVPSRLILLVDIVVFYSLDVLVALSIYCVIGIYVMRSIDLLVLHCVLKVHQVLLFLLLGVIRRDENLLLTVVALLRHRVFASAPSSILFEVS